MGEPLQPGREHVWIRPEEVALSRKNPGSAANVLEGRILRVADTLWTVHVVCGELALQVMLTDARFQALGLGPGDTAWLSFGDAALHCL